MNITLLSAGVTATWALSMIAGKEALFKLGHCAQEVEQLRAENAKMLAAVEGRQAALARGSEQVTRTRVAVDTASRECATSSAAIRSAQIYHSSRLNQQCFPGAKHHAHVCTCMLQEMQWRAQT